MTAVNSQTETCFDMTSGGIEFLIRRSPNECQSTNYFISQLGEPVISQRDYKINEGGTQTF